MFKQAIRDFLAARLARWMRHFALDPRYFNLWQAHGYHVKQVHFYSPLPDTRELPERLWRMPGTLPGLELNEAGQLALLDAFTRFRPEYATLPTARPSGPPRFYFGNGSFEALDAEVLYCMVRHHQPRRMVEIGSGFTTLLAAQALAQNRTEGHDAALTAIEPYPPSFLHETLPFPIELVAEPVQSVRVDRFTDLRAGDILFIDSSHVCKIGSDVQYEFLEILPRLAPGVLVHIHDIFLPFEYPQEWVKDWHRFWNEQYLLQAFLCGNQDFEVLWAGTWMHSRHADKLAVAFPAYDPRTTWPGSFWMRRRRELA